MSLVEFAKSELSMLGVGAEEQDMFIKMIETFAQFGHSGSSAMWSIQILNNLLRYKPLSAITGEDSEWTEVSDGLYQNKRMFSVFKDANSAWDIDGRVEYSFTLAPTDVADEYMLIVDGDYLARKNDIKFPYTQNVSAEKFDVTTMDRINEILVVLPNIREVSETARERIKEAVKLNTPSARLVAVLEHLEK